MAGLLRSTAITLTIIIGLALAAVLFYPMKATINAVFEQPTEPLPEPFRQAWRYSISDSASPVAVYLSASQPLVRATDYPGPGLGIRPLPIAARLVVFARFTQVEWLGATAHMPPCWTKDLTELTADEALYLAALTVGGTAANEERIRSRMTRIAERAAEADSHYAAAFVAAAAGPLPICE
jgi:hypothetical protein